MSRCGVSVVVLFFLLIGSVSAALSKAYVGSRLERIGDEIVVAGQLFHTGVPVILWTDEGGYDAYRTELRFSPYNISSYSTYSNMPSSETGWSGSGPVTYNLRSSINDEEIEEVRGGGWTLEQVQRVVDQFVLHYDVVAYSKGTFRVLHDERALSVHFMLDVDGTIYQTLDVKERAWHATIANSRSVGIEIANIGAYPVGGSNPFAQWYTNRGTNDTQLIIPPDSWTHTPNFIGHPARPDPISGFIRNEHLEMYDYTMQQYNALSHLIAALNVALPRIRIDYPRDNVTGELLTRTLTEEEFKTYTGVLGHYHVQTNKADPGPALQWDFLLNNAKALLADVDVDTTTAPPRPTTPNTPAGVVTYHTAFLVAAAAALIFLASTVMFGVLFCRARRSTISVSALPLEETNFTIDDGDL